MKTKSVMQSTLWDESKVKLDSTSFYKRATLSTLETLFPTIGRTDDTIINISNRQTSVSVISFQRAAIFFDLRSDYWKIIDLESEVTKLVKICIHLVRILTFKIRQMWTLMQIESFISSVGM